MTAPTVPIVQPSAPPYAVRRAKKGKFCASCSARIPAGALYRLYSLYRWACFRDCAGGGQP